MTSTWYLNSNFTNLPEMLTGPILFEKIKTSHYTKYFKIPKNLIFKYFSRDLNNNWVAVFSNNRSGY